MQEFYETPVMMIISVRTADDVITTSGLETETGGGGNDHQFGN